MTAVIFSDKLAVIILELKRGDPESQQGFEAIALLIAVRLWLPFWKSKRFSLALGNDNIGA